ncbi:LysR family transcriptional regulator [Pseudonocardia nematodicida]|uniref:LysR family transcriptional regulator n=1 Tax=Pseudonocardia nematodicida TaxID=1206997 RepID=A0ABV1KIZ0_9PSEU
MGLELRHLHAFTVVAEELHFGRAAARLHISQPALSQQIRVLEKGLGAVLFRRSSHSVTLTEAGRELRDSAPRVLFEAKRAEDRVREAHEGTRGTLTVGSVGSALASITPRIMARLGADAPDVRIDLSLTDTVPAMTALEERRLDVAVVRPAAPHPRIDRELLLSEPLVAVLPAGHRLAGVDVVDITELADEPFVLWDRGSGPEFFDTIVGYCRDNGVDPRVVVEGEEVQTQLALVAAGLGVSLLPSYWTSLQNRSLVFRPLCPEPPRVALHLAWRRNDPSPLLRRFLDAARAVVRTPDSP